MISFAIDRGGTFTDCVAHYKDDEGRVKIEMEKLLSEDPENYQDASREGIRRLLCRIKRLSISREDKIPINQIGTWPY